MIEVTKHSKRSTGGRGATLTSVLTPQQIHNEAMAVMEQGLSSIAWRALDLLFAGGIMTVDQLGLTPRTLRRYASKRIVDRYAFSPKFVIQKLGEYGLQVADGQLYTLGPVGAEIARMRHGVTPPSGYLAFTLERVLHDVIVNEIVQRIANEAETHGWKTIWASKYEATIFKEGQEIQLLEPDAFIRVERGEQEYPFLIEYHNEDKRTRATQKVYRYESAYDSDLWQETWEVTDDAFPPLLAVFRNKIVNEGYKDGLRELGSVHCNYYGRTLKGFLADGGLDDWFYYNAQEKAQVFPWLKEF